MQAWPGKVGQASSPRPLWGLLDSELVEGDMLVVAYQRVAWQSAPGWGRASQCPEVSPGSWAPAAPTASFPDHCPRRSFAHTFPRALRGVSGRLTHLQGGQIRQKETDLGEWGEEQRRLKTIRFCFVSLS